MTVAATRRASKTRRGIVAASVRPSPTARPTAATSCRNGVSPAGMLLPQARLGPPDDTFDGFTVGAGREGQGHAMLEHRLRKRDHVINGRGVATIEQGAGAHCKHERLARARAGPPSDQLADGAALRT